MYYTSFETNLAEIILAGDEQGLAHLHINNPLGTRKFAIDSGWIKNDLFFIDIKNQLHEYLAGERKIFDIALNLKGTDYQKTVWKALQTIPYGETRSYKELAVMIGNPKASRAVGMANGKNKIPIIIPCHRVIGSNGKLTGFAHGIDIKEKLIYLENKNR